MPQFLARQEFIDDLAETALRVGAAFVEIALLMSHAETLQAFAQRSASPDNQQHRDTAALIERAGGLARLGEMHDRLMELLATGPSVDRIEVVRGDVEARCD